MAVTAAMVKELRDKTGAGMSACKSALTESDGVMDRAIEILREKGLAAAAKKAGRVAAEGLVLADRSDDGKRGVVVEVNIETDFAAKNQDFVNYVTQIAAQALASSVDTVEALMDENWIADSSVTVKDALTQKISIIGENINVRRFERFIVDGDGTVVQYIHAGGKVGVMIELATTVVNDLLIEAGRNVCMQIAAMSPRFISRADVSEDFIAKEREILTQQAINEGKPANIAEKMVEGRLAKELKEFCLLDQEYVRDNELTISSYLKKIGDDIGSAITIKRFIRFEKGEGIEKKEENFAEEVSKAMNG